MWREPTKGTKKYEYLSTQNNSVSTGISEENPRGSEENPRETALVKLLLNKHLLNITGNGGDYQTACSPEENPRETGFACEEIGGKLRTKVSNGEIY